MASISPLYHHRNHRNEPRHDKTNKMSVRPAKTQISLGIRPVWSESSLCAQWIAKGLRCLHVDSEDSGQAGRMPRLIWVFAGRTLTLLVLSCRGLNEQSKEVKNRIIHSKTQLTKWHVYPGKTQISMDIRSVGLESSLAAWRNLGSLATHWARSGDSDLTVRMPRLIWVFAVRTAHFVCFVVLQLRWVLEGKTTIEVCNTINPPVETQCARPPDHKQKFIFYLGKYVNVQTLSLVCLNHSR